MKRSVAILGHTPQFVRWAIAHSCPLRQFTDNLADNSFRQLRGLRALSVGRVEGRIVDQVCIHPDADPEIIAEARGFMASEVLDAFGEEGFVEAQCGSCPANAVSDSVAGVWTGCYGLLPNDTSFEFELIREANDSRDGAPTKPEFNLALLINRAIAEGGLERRFEELFEHTNPRWYGIWQAKKFNRSQLEILIEVFDRVAELQSGRSRDLRQFYDALTRCQSHELELHVELVPSGFSDGQTWTISSCCPQCKCALTNERQCPACGRKGNPHECVKSKVVGLRPYVFLSRVLGVAKTEELVRKWQAIENATD